MIMLTGSFIHVDVRPSELGNRHTGNSYVKHRSPPSHLPLACKMMRSNSANGKIKENKDLR